VQHLSTVNAQTDRSHIGANVLAISQSRAGIVDAPRRRVIRLITNEPLDLIQFADQPVNGAD
jgi:hypothetical protein